MAGAFAKQLGVCIGALWLLGARGAAAAVLVPVPNDPLPDWAQLKRSPAKRALVVGIGDYAQADDLATPQHDAALVAKALLKTDPNFQVTAVPSEQHGRTALLGAIKSFSENVQPGDVVFVYFSGHGLERDGFNYIVPADAGRAKAGHEAFAYISIDHVLTELRKREPGITVLLLDACRKDAYTGAAQEALPRDGPAGVADAASQVAPSAEQFAQAADALSPPQRPGLAPMTTPPGFMVGYAAQPGAAAFSLFRNEQQHPERGSIFTRNLTKYLTVLNQPIDRVFSATSGKVQNDTGLAQAPFLNQPNAGELLLLENENLGRNEEEFWRRMVLEAPPGEEAEYLQIFLNTYPAGPYAYAARRKLKPPPDATSTGPDALARAPQEPAPPAAAASQPTATALLTSGPLKLPTLSVQENFIVARSAAFVRATPWAKVSKVVDSVSVGARLRLLDAAARPGWAKVQLENGRIGYIGSVAATTTDAATPLLSLPIAGDDGANAKTVSTKLTQLLIPSAGGAAALQKAESETTLANDADAKLSEAISKLSACETASGNAVLTAGAEAKGALRNFMIADRKLASPSGSVQEGMVNAIDVQQGATKVKAACATLGAQLAKP